VGRLDLAEPLPLELRCTAILERFHLPMLFHGLGHKALPVCLCLVIYLLRSVFLSRPSSQGRVEKLLLKRGVEEDVTSFLLTYLTEGMTFIDVGANLGTDKVQLAAFYSIKIGPLETMALKTPEALTARTP
jgi:hypothetical protein